MPASLPVAEYFGKERGAITALDDALAALEQQLTEMVEENSGEERLLNEVIAGEGARQKITAQAVKSRLKPNPAR